MKCKTIFCEIKDQLLSSRALLLSQREYLISAITLIEAGEPLEAAFSRAELPSRPRGKAAIEYQSATQKRNAWLNDAANCFNGTTWQKCRQLADVCNTSRRLHRGGQFVPRTEAERIVKRILDAGFKLPMTSQGIQSAINNQKLNLSNP